MTSSARGEVNAVSPEIQRKTPMKTARRRAPLGDISKPKESSSG